LASAASIGAARVKPAQLARELGVTRQSVHELIARGILVKDADGLIDTELAKLALANRVRPSSKTAQALGVPPPVQGPAAPSAPQSAAEGQAETNATAVGNYHGAKALREAAEASIAEIRLRRLQGEVTELAPMVSAIHTCSRVLRDTCLAVGKRVAADAVASGDAATAERLITAEIRRAFEAFDRMASSAVERERLRDMTTAT
jgi:hypothetical protein